MSHTIYQSLVGTDSIGKRDFFAAMVMHACLQTHATGEWLEPQNLAPICVSYADILIAELAKPK